MPNHNRKEAQDKTIVFRHKYKVEALAGTVSQRDMEDQLLQDVLAKGYVPLMPLCYDRIQRGVGMIDRVWTQIAYAGKRQALEIWEKHRKSLNRGHFDRINIFP